MIETLLLTSSVIYLILASLNDIKHRFVHDYLTYSFGLFFLILRLLLFLQNQSLSNLKFLYFTIPTFIISYLLYKLGAWGGGDLKLLTVLSVGIPYFSTDEMIPFFINFLSNTLIASVLFGMVWTLYLFYKNKKKIWKRFNKVDLIVIIIPFIISFLFLSKDKLWNILLMLLFFTPFAYLSKRFEKELQVIDKKVSNLEEGDWIIKNIKTNKGVVKQKRTGLTKDDIELLQKSSRKIIKVKDGIPFVPGFLISLIITWINGNLIINFVESVVTSI